MGVPKMKKKLTFSPFMDPDIPQEEYNHNIFSHVKNYHNGQRKLQNSEVMFLTTYPDIKTVVYVASADGTHLNVLTKMFPEHEWHFYDPRKTLVKETKKIHVY